MADRSTNPIRRRRLNKALTQEQLAASLSPPVSVQSVKLWEWGRWSPSGRSVRALAEFFGVTIKTIRTEYEEWKNEPDDEEEAGS